ncbi:hypothetical protein [Rhizorhabdus sp.]|uniref:hypothetical protein n=1 Tax=Rhizorhabdus sp. TaxID=1968843 RepID=UPI0035B01FDF
MGGDPDGAGDGVSPVRLSPAPKGPDDGAPIVCMIDGQIALLSSPDRAPLCLLSPDAAARLGTHLIYFANAAGSEAIF